VPNWKGNLNKRGGFRQSKGDSKEKRLHITGGFKPGIHNRRGSDGGLRVSDHRQAKMKKKKKKS